MQIAFAMAKTCEVFSTVYSWAAFLLRTYQRHCERYIIKLNFELLVSREEESDGSD
jgi:hypothetical protein